MSDPHRLSTPSAAFARYEEVRTRLPQASFPSASRRVPDLDAAADLYDGFVLDAYGVLNVGSAVVPSAVARIASLRSSGKRLCVLSNAASYMPSGALAKFRGLGFDFDASEIVTSRGVASARLDALAPGAVWAAIADADDDLVDLGVTAVDASRGGALEDADAVLFLSSSRYDAAVHDRLCNALSARPRPIVIANPDIVSPREDGLAREPGYWAHDLIDRTGCPVHWFGKPYADAFDDAIARMDLDADRVAMVGDTLHTDILGGRAAGFGTILVTGHGLFAGSDVGGAIERSGIVPDIVADIT